MTEGHKTGLLNLLRYHIMQYVNGNDEWDQHVQWLIDNLCPTGVLV